METMEGITPTYNLAEHGDGFGFGGSGIWLFAILALFFFGGAGGWNSQSSRAATVEDLSNSANFTRLESQVMANGQATERKADGIVNGISSLGYEMAQQFGATNTAMQAGFCGISKEILDSRYQTVMAIGEQASQIKEMLNQNKIEALQAKVASLELANATATTVKYPTSMSYSAGTSPFCANVGCGCAY